MTKKVVLGVAGGIAAYKACELLRRLRENGNDVTVVPTPAALEFVGRTTWEALSGKRVNTDVWSDITDVPHVRIGQQADLVIVAPATADLLARAASGRADDLLTNVLLTARCPVLMAPAMHTEMWQHPATVANVATLRSRGVVVLDPDSGRLTGADTGPGRLPDPDVLADACETVLAAPALAAPMAERDLAGLNVVISAGGTREHLDPVRFLGNASSGRMGVALARAAAQRGAAVTLVAAAIDVPPPAGVVVERVTSTADLDAAMGRLAPGADVVIMAAAVADYTPRQASTTKLKKDGHAGLDLQLTQTTDVLARLATVRPQRQTLVGFAAETAADEAELLQLGRQKLARKGCSVLVVNEVRGGALFGSADNSVLILTSDDAEPLRYAGTKSEIAHHILDAARPTGAHSGDDRSTR